MDKNTLYIYEKENKVIEVNNFFEAEHFKTFYKIFNDLCLKELTTLKGRIDAVKKVFSYAYNLPIYINQDMIFIKLIENKTIWINAINIADIKKTSAGAIIYFKGGKVFETTKSYRSINNSYKRIIEITNYKNDFIL